MVKRGFLLVLTLFVLSVTTFTQTNRAQTEQGNKNVNCSPLASGSATDPVERRLPECENQFWQAMKHKDIDRLNNLIADDARFVDEYNVISKSAFTRSLSTLSVIEYSVRETEVSAIGKEAAIVNYRINVRYSSNGVLLPRGAVLITSVWVIRDGKWKIKHHHASFIQVVKADP